MNNQGDINPVSETQPMNKLSNYEVLTSIAGTNNETKAHEITDCQIRKIFNIKQINVKRLQANIANKKSLRMSSPQINSSKSRSKKNKAMNEESMAKGFNQPQTEKKNPTFNQIEEAMREIKELKKLLEEKEKALTEMNKRNQILVSANIET